MYHALEPIHIHWIQRLYVWGPSNCPSDKYLQYVLYYCSMYLGLLIFNRQTLQLITSISFQKVYSGFRSLLGSSGCYIPMVLDGSVCRASQAVCYWVDPRIDWESGARASSVNLRTRIWFEKLTLTTPSKRWCAWTTTTELRMYVWPSEATWLYHLLGNDQNYPVFIY